MSRNIYVRMGVAAPFDATHILVTSPVLSPQALAIVRLVLAVYTFVALLFILIWDGVKLHTANSFFSYFTELSYIGLCSYFWASGVQTFAYGFRIGGGHRKGYPLQHWPRPLQFLHVLLFSTITTFPFLVTIVYWVELSSSATFSTRFNAWSNISIHALNSVFALFEILLTHAGPTPWSHIPFIIILLAGYLGIAYITHATQGFYTYSFLDPAKEHGKLAGWIVGIAVGGAIIFSITRTMCYLRERILARYGRGSGSVVSRSGSVMSQRTEEWETVERPGSRLV
ncbi:hypothetical protein BD410DRAFT_789978 [Rickenella mellea]|uniref:FAR-17a/AIG1-like protein n=1 Tax=Rickenella mellea TaxID=50990 RepID=A0A4Y7Q0N4_9AGAM|nr:hypothetical protein BD410DRAFT_789978 [Rickenella mellea]